MKITIETDQSAERLGIPTVAPSQSIVQASVQPETPRDALDAGAALANVSGLQTPAAAFAPSRPGGEQGLSAGAAKH